MNKFSLKTEAVRSSETTVQSGRIAIIINHCLNDCNYFCMKSPSGTKRKGSFGANLCINILDFLRKKQYDI